MILLYLFLYIFAGFLTAKVFHKIEKIDSIFIVMWIILLWPLIFIVLIFVMPDIDTKDLVDKILGKGKE